MKNFSWSFDPFFAWALLAVLSSAFISLFLSFQLGFFVLLFIIVGWWVWQEPERGFIFLLIAAPLFPLLKATQTLGTLTLMKDVIIITLFVRACLWPLVTKKLVYRRDIFVLPVVGLWLWTGLDWLLADTPILGILRARDIILYSLLYFAVLYLDHDAPTVRRRLKWALAILSIVAVLAIDQWFFALDSTVLRFDPARQIWIPRLSSTLGHPSVFGHILGIAIGWLVAVLLISKQRVAKILSSLGLVILLPFLYLTYSRGVWFGVAAAMAVMVVAFLWGKLHERHVRFSWAYFTLVVGIFCLLAVSVFQTTAVGIFIRSAFDPTYASNQARLDFVARLIAPMTNAQALFGRGLGDVVAQTFRQDQVDVTSYDVATGASRTVQVSKDSTLVDNQYLKTFVEMGLAGLLIYVWIYWRFGRASWHLFRSQNLKTTIIGLGGIGFITFFVTQGFFIDTWDIFPTNMIFWIIAAVLSAELSKKVDYVEK